MFLITISVLPCVKCIIKNKLDALKFLCVSKFNDFHDLHNNGKINISEYMYEPSKITSVFLLLKQHRNKLFKPLNQSLSAVKINFRSFNVSFAGLFF